MGRKKNFCFCLLVSGFLLMSGCAAKQIKTDLKPVKTKLSSYNILKIEKFYYDSKVEIDSREKADKLRDMFQDRVKYDLYNLSVFEKVIEEEAVRQGDRVVVLKGRITYMKRVTGATRVLFGAMAGRARVDVVVQLTDQRTGEVLGETDIKGTSTGGSIFAGGTEEAFQNASQLISEYIRANY